MRALFFQMMQRRTSIASIPEPPPFEVWNLLWRQLEKLVHPAEVFEIQQVIGNSLIQENESLQKEVIALLDIWKDIRQTTDQQLQVSASQKLPEPPAKTLLKRKVSLLLEELGQREIPGTRGVNWTPKEKEIVEFVQQDIPTRPRSAKSPRIEQGEIPLDFREDRRPGSAKHPSRLPLTIEPIKSLINVQDIQKVRDVIISALKEEQKLLLEDISYLQKCLEEEISFKTKAVSYGKQVAPSYQDLKDLSVKLEELCKSKVVE